MPHCTDIHLLIGLKIKILSAVKRTLQGDAVCIHSESVPVPSSASKPSESCSELGSGRPCSPADTNCMTSIRGDLGHSCSVRTRGEPSVPQLGKPLLFHSTPAEKSHAVFKPGTCLLLTSLSILSPGGPSLPVLSVLGAVSGLVHLEASDYRHWVSNGRNYGNFLPLQIWTLYCQYP